MKCKDIRSVIRQSFDENRLENLPGEVHDHLQACEDCREYFLRLQTLEEGIQNLKQASIPLPQFKSRVLQVRRKRRQLPVARRLILVASAIIIAIFIFVVQRQEATKNYEEKVAVDSGVRLKEAFIDNRPANVVFIQSGEKQKITMVWLY